MSEAGNIGGPKGPARSTEHLTPDETFAEAEIRAPEPGARPYESASVGNLLSRLVDDVAILLRKELALATSEVSHAVNEAKAGLGSAVAGGAVLYAGVLFLLLAATFALAEVMPDWAAALIVGGVVTLIGAIMFSAGKRKMSAQNFKPDRAVRSVQKDADMIERQRP